MSVPTPASDLAIVIVSFRVPDLLGRCLETIAHAQASTARTLQTIVVDNASGDDSVDRARAFAWADVVPLPVNVGFAAANNIGASRARARRLMFLNPDTELSAETVERLLDALDKTPHAGIVAPRLDNADGSLQVSCYRFPTLGRALADATPLPWVRPFGRFGAHRFCDPSHGAPRRVDWACGACLVMDADLFAALDGFDERFFMYSEDVDLCRRVHAAGRGVLYVPAARVVHHGNQSEKMISAGVFSRAGRSTVQYYRIAHPGRPVKWLTLTLRASAAIGRLTGAVASLVLPSMSSRIQSKNAWQRGLARAVARAAAETGWPARRHPALRLKSWLKSQSRFARGVDRALRATAAMTIATYEQVLRLAPAPDRAHAMASVRTVVFTSFYGLGDALLDQPAVAAVRRALPHARIRMVCSRRHADLWAHQPEVDELIAVDESEFLATARRLRRESVDLFVLLHTNLEFYLFGRLLGARFIAGYLWNFRAVRASGFRAPAIPVDDRSHLVRSQRVPPLLSGVSEPLAQPALHLVAADHAAADALLHSAGIGPNRPLVAVNPNKTAAWLGAGRWPPQRWRAVIAELRRRQATVVVLGSAAEREEVAAIIAGCADDPLVVSLAGHGSLRTTAAVLARCDLLVTTDSGLMHLAGAVGTPAVSLFTFSDIGSFISGASNRPVHAPVPCSPCVRNGSAARDHYPPICPYDYRCGRAVTVEQMVTAIASAPGRTSLAEPVR